MNKVFFMVNIKIGSKYSLLKDKTKRYKRNKTKRYKRKSERNVLLDTSLPDNIITLVIRISNESTQNN